MIKKYALVLITLLCSFFYGFGQTIVKNSFEQTATDTWIPLTFSTPPCNAGNGDQWDYDTVLSSITPSEGSQFWGIQDLNGSCGGTGFETISFPSYNISAYSGVTISFDYYTIGFDTGDDLGYEIWEDGVKVVDLTNLNDNTNSWITVTYNVTASTTNVYIVLKARQNGASDYGAFDNVILNGTASCSPPNTPNGSISGTNPACNSTTLTYTHGAGQPQTNVVYYWQTTANGTSTANPTSTGLIVNTNGIYYVRAYNTATSCWSTASLASSNIIINTPPAITTQPQPFRTISVGTNTTFSIAANNANSYQWEVSTNGGANWASLTNGGVYSGVTTTTLTITGATLGMDGYQYRCLAIASPCADATSNAGLLTVYNTPPNNGLNLVACIAETSIDLSWNAATGGATGYIVFVQTGTTIPEMDVSSAGYANTYIANSNYAAANTYTTLGKAVYKGAGTSATVTNLTSGNDYTFKVVAYNSETQTGWANGIYNTNMASSYIQTYTIGMPLANITSASIAQNSSVIDWTNPLPTSCYEILIVANQGGATTFTPTGDGSAYVANANYSGPDSFVFKGNGITTTVTNLTEGIQYCYTIFVRNRTTNDWSRGNTVCETTGIDYCDSFGDATDNYNTGVRMVQLGTYINNSPDEDNDYSDYTAIPINVFLGESYPLTVNVNTDGNWTVYSRVWIDWNNDGTFIASEQYELGSATNVNNGPTSGSGLTINVPTNAYLGNVRMRVSAEWDNNPTACNIGFDGEVEDYTINISRPTGPEIFVEGNNNVITSGDTTTSGLNNTAFGASNVGTPDSNTLIIESIGTQSLILDGTPRVQISGANASDFVVTSQPVNTSLASGAQDTFEITFTPSEAGLRTATVSIENNDVTDAEDPFTFAINGIGNGREINVKGNSISIPSGSGIPELSTNNFTIFGEANINTSEVISKTFSLENIGNQALTISNITLTGPDAADFTIISPTGITIPADSNSPLQIEFSPTTIGIKDAVITITHNDGTGGESPYTFSVRGIGVNYIICVSDQVQTIAIQDFEDSPATPTWSFTNTQTYASTVSIAGGTGYGAVGDGGNSPLYLGNKSFQLNNTVDTNWAYAYLEFSSIDTQGYDDIELSIRVGAFSKSSSLSGLDSDDVIVSISEDNGTTWSDEVQVTGRTNSRWSFTSGTGIASVTYDNNNTIESPFTPSVGGQFQTTEGYSTINVVGLPSVSNLMVRITLKNNRFDEVWAIDDVLLTGKIPSVKTWGAISNNWRDMNNNITTAPTSSQKAIIAGDYSTATYGNIEACECEINSSATLTITNGTYVSIENNVTNHGTIDIQTRGSFVQRGDGAAAGTFTNSGAGIATVNKHTATFDSDISQINYTYWSSPVNNPSNPGFGEDISNVFPSPVGNRRYYFEAANFLDNEIEVGNNNAVTVGQDDIDDNGDDWQYASGAMEIGRGYAVTTAGVPPSGLYSDNSTVFSGALNTGDITVTLYKNNNEINDNNWNFIGNPYPSAISVDDFFNANIADVPLTPPINGETEGAIFLWSQSVAPDANNNGNEQINFAQSDYAIINRATEIAGTSGIIPDPYIPSGQGFFVALTESLSTSENTITSANIVFTNSMRRTGDNTQFFEANDGSQNIKTTDSNNVYEKNILWLNMSSDNGVFSQIAVAYVNGATDAYDGWSFDTPRNLSTGTYAMLYSVIDSSERQFAIQGKSPESLTLDEVIPLGFDTSIDEATLYKFSIPQLEGSFMNQNDIFIKDNLLNKTHNLKESDYSFTSEVGEFTDRFEIVFTEDALSVGEVKIDKNTLQIIELPNGNVQFKVSSQYEMKSIEIVDLLGRTLYQLDAQGNSQTFSLSNLSQATYLAKVKLSNGSVITKKAIKRK